MTYQAHVVPSLPRPRSWPPAGTYRGGQHRVALGLLASVIAVDQVTKWWGWRYAPKAIINSGGTWPIWEWVSNAYSGPITGALLDLVSCGVMSLAAFALLRRRRPVLVLASGALMIGGWCSNLSDRLGMHVVTAPGSDRGAVDYIHLGAAYYNVADLVIVGATPLLLVALCALGRRSRHPGPVATLPTRDRSRAPRRAWRSVAAVGFAVAVAGGTHVAVGAVSEVGLGSPSASPAAAALASV